MLKNSLYRIDAQRQTPERLEVDLTLWSAHAIFDGHFPGQPILPGVCTLQISKELLTDFVGTAISIVSCQSIKYKQLIDPRTISELRFSFKIGLTVNSTREAAVTVTTHAGDILCSMRIGYVNRG